MSHSIAASNCWSTFSACIGFIFFAVTRDETGSRWADADKNLAAIDRMVSPSVRGLTKERCPAMERHLSSFQSHHGHGDTECKAGEKIAVKANLNNTTDHDTIDRLNSSPHLLLPLVRQLTGPGKVPQSSITAFHSGAARRLNLPLVLSDRCGLMLHAFWPRAA